MLTTHLHLRPK